MVSKTNGAAVALVIAVMTMGFFGCPAWHSDAPPRIPAPDDPVACDPSRAEDLEGRPCAPNAETCELDCRDERAQCVVLVCEQFTWRKMNIPPPPPP